MDTWEAPATQEADAAPGGWFTCDVMWGGPIENGQVWILLREVGGSFSGGITP
jgi:hypothetical protein